MQTSQENQRVEHVLLHKEAPQVDVLYNGDLGVVWAEGREVRDQGGREKVGRKWKVVR